jgi:hypothetical protein
MQMIYSARPEMHQGLNYESKEIREKKCMN